MLKLKTIPIGLLSDFWCLGLVRPWSMLIKSMFEVNFGQY